MSSATLGASSILVGTTYIFSIKDPSDTVNFLPLFTTEYNQKLQFKIFIIFFLMKKPVYYVKYECIE